MEGHELRFQRETQQLSQSKLSELSGISQALLSSFELGKQTISIEHKDTINGILSTLDNEKVNKIKKKRYTKNKANIDSLNIPRKNYNSTANNSKYLELLEELESNFNSNSDTKLKAMSFFAGCGGLCYGIKAAGFDIVATNELEEAYKKIYKKNFANANFLPNDITEIEEQDIQKVLDKHKDIDLLVGGPPCQGFSLAGKRDVNDKRNSLFEYYLNLANIIRPKVILIENVRLLTSMKDPNGELVSDRIIKTFKSLQYQCDFFYVNAKAYGVAQSRERVIFIAIREDINVIPSVPAPLYGSNRPYFSFGDATSDLEYIESGESSKKDKYHKAVSHPHHVLEWLKDVPEGKSAHDNECVSMRPPSGYNTTYKRQLWNEPAKTVGTTFAMISGSNNVHPIATRSLTVREALRIQSFPDSFQLDGKLGDIRTTIGNAVPPLLAFELAKHIKDTYIL